MGYDSILVPLDGSELAELALPHAIRIANPGAAIRLLSVMDADTLTEIAVNETKKLTRPEMNRKMKVLAPRDAAVPVLERKEYLLQHADYLEAQGFSTSTQLVAGYPGSAIADVAAEGFEIVVLSTHGRTGLRRILIGSVAESLLHHCPCPVCIVPAYRRSQ